LSKINAPAQWFGYRVRSQNSSHIVCLSKK
jgi:hypothetical protein